MFLNKKPTIILILALTGYFITSSILTPTDIAADANFHMGSIYCQTNNSTLCSKLEENKEAVFPTNIMPSKCQNLELKYENKDCKSILKNKTTYAFNSDQYPHSYYKFYSNFVIDKIPIVSIFVIRIMNALPFVIIALIINFSIGKKYAFGFSLGHIIFSGVWGYQFYFTFNPSSWLLLGLTALPIFLENFLHKDYFGRRIVNFLTTIFLIFIILNSRPDGKYWLLLVFICFSIYVFVFRSTKFISIFIMILILGYTLNYGLLEQFITNISGFTLSNSYSDNFAITKIDLIVHNILLSPLYLLSFFGLEYSLENLIPSLLYSIPIFFGSMQLIRKVVADRTLKLYIMQLVLFSCGIVIFYSIIDYLLIYDKRIGTRYVFPIWSFLLINVLTQATQKLELQSIRKTNLFIAIGTLIGLLMNIKRAHEGFNSGIFIVLNSDFFHFNQLIILCSIFIYLISFMYILNYFLSNIAKINTPQ
jgi:hypothetical protein